MVTHYRTAGKFSLAAILVGVCIAAATTRVQAIPLSRGAWPIYTAVVEKTTPPSGWAEFCHTYKSECDVQSTLPRKIALTAEVWDKLVEVNHWANAHIKPTPDRKHWGRINKWYFAEDGRGDCKDYVLVKRRMLMQSGLPRETLLISVVWTPQNNGHAVLIVRTDKGDYVLDSLASKIVRWNQTPYDYVMRQTQSNPNSWVYIDGDPLKPAKVSEETTENPLNEPTILVSGLNNGQPKEQLVVADESGGYKPQMVSTLGMGDGSPSRTSNQNAIASGPPAIAASNQVPSIGSNGATTTVKADDASFP